MTIKSEEIKIVAKLMDPERCQFTVDRPVVMAGGVFQFQSENQARESPLAQEIFEIGHGRVSAIRLTGNQVTVAAVAGTDWRLLGKVIGQAIREHLISETAHFEQVLAGLSEQSSSEEQIRMKVQQVLDTQINPGVAGHGGKISLLDVKGQAIYIQMAGGCQGCGQASVTLKSGVEKAIRQYVPEVQEIFDTTDHGSGKKPFYK
jgi:Fe-S cluster biogenesis protein NfuA